MNLRMNRAFSLALLAGALGIGASVAHAQGNYKGSFNLPVEALGLSHVGARPIHGYG